MTPTPPALLDELWDSISTGPAPVEDLVMRGRTKQRRRRLGVAGGAAALVAAAVIAVTVVPRSTEHEERVLTPPPGTRYVGIGQVVVAVPENWADGAASCNSPVKDTVFFPWPQDCVGLSHAVSSVEISAVLMNDGLTSKPVPHGHLDGHQVVARSAFCNGGTGPETCFQTFGVPDLHAYFSVHVPRGDPSALDQVKAIRDSLTLLPKGQTTVPFATKWAEWRAAFRRVGLEVRVHHTSCPETATCLGPFPTTPPAGYVVPTGSTVTIVVQD